MARSSPSADVHEYRHDAKRKNNPPAGLAAQGRVAETPKHAHHYDPHLPPTLRFDQFAEADDLEGLLAEALERPLKPEEALRLLRHTRPWLEWTGKREKAGFEVEPVALHVHERVAAQAIVKALRREDVQRDLFADPQLPYGEAVKFYQHDVDWANRLILGDSLQVMASLGRREGLQGQVQMIYLDPPYGIRFKSNFQPKVEDRNVGDAERDLTREPEMVKAYRDTWKLGIHSYLDYLRDRLVLSRELLTDSGSIFVQIGDENLHVVRNLLDEVFGPENFVSQIAFQTTSGFETNALASVYDTLLWFARDKEQAIAQDKIKRLYEKQEPIPGEGNARWVLFPSGRYRGVKAKERRGERHIPKEVRFYNPDNLQSQGAASEPQPFEFEGEVYEPNSSSHWKANYPEGMQRLAHAGRIHVARNSIRFRRFADDFPYQVRGNLWTDTLTGSFTEKKRYVVQTNTKVVERCMLLTTDPGDLVLDPTCGSGTTAYAAEKWGRRWIMIDTSRVALAIARQRLLSAVFPMFKLEENGDDRIRRGRQFVYRSAPHIMLRDIVNNAAIDSIAAKHDPRLEERLNALNIALQNHITEDLRRRLAQKLKQKEKDKGKRAVTEADERRWKLPQGRFEHWTVPFDTDEDWPEELKAAVEEYHAVRRKKQEEVEQAIAAGSEHEILRDRPEVEKGVVRVSGPITVEAVIPAEQSLDDAMEETPIGGALKNLDTFDGDATAEATNAEAYLDKLTRLLREDGARFLGNKTQGFTRLDRISDPVLHAEGEWTSGDGEAQSVGVSFGPEHGAVTAKQVEEALYYASKRGYDHLIIAGFNFDGAAQAVIQDDPNPRVRVHMANVAPDVMMDDLLKKPAEAQLFTVFGQPRTSLLQHDDGTCTVHMEGMDVYDPVTNTLKPTKGQKVAAWFLDADYDGRTFCITQAFFPDKSAWKKIARALKGEIEPDAFERLSGTESLPFRPGEYGRVAVKVIDPRGNEALRIHRLNVATS